MDAAHTEMEQSRTFRVRDWFVRLLGRQKPISMTQRAGKRATTPGDLADEARRYIRARMYGKGGVPEAWAGFWHKTFPFLMGREARPTLTSVLVLLLRFATLCGAAALPVIGRRAMQSSNLAPGLDGMVQILSNLEAIDYMIAAAGVLVVGLPKQLESFARKTSPRRHSPYGDLAAAIHRMPSLVPNGDALAITDSLRHVLAALKIEMSELIADPKREQLTDVTLLEYCDDGRQMHVTARTAIGEDTHRPRDSSLFMANFVGLEGRWFAENDFLRKQNPFKPIRLTVAGNPEVNYRSVLFLPITTAMRVHELAPTQHGPVALVKDYCIGVICVQSHRQYRFWRWGDHKKVNGGGFGDIAYERALPYIRIITKLIEHRAPKVPLEAK